MWFRSRPRVVPSRTPGELDAMAAAGAVVGQALVAVRDAAVAGVSTAELDAIAEQVIRDKGAQPSFKGYQGYPATICASVNDVVVHGIPGADTVLREGDLVSIDCGAIVDGWHGDSAWTFGIGALAPEYERLNETCEKALEAGIAAMVDGGFLTDISHAVEKASGGFAVVANYGGHGIGTEMHMDPFLPNEGAAGRGPRLVVGSTLAIEPMLTAGSRETVVLDDDWTVVTDDGSFAAHWEHTVAVTADGPRILTQRPI